MRCCHPIRWVGTLVLVVLLTSTAVPISAQSAEGRLSVWAWDAVNGLRISDICVTVTQPGDPTPIEPVDFQYPAGTYDVLVEHCAGDYADVTFEAVDVGPDGRGGDSTELNVFMVLENQAAVTGRIVDAYSGYPIRYINAATYALDGTVIDYVSSDEFGRYLIYAHPDVPINMRFDDVSRFRYRSQWFPYTWSKAEAEELIPRLGKELIAHAALEVDGGFVGRFVDSDDPTAPIPDCMVRAWPGGVMVSTRSRTDGSFTLEETGPNITIEVQCEGSEGGLLADLDNPSRPAEWDVERGESVDLGVIRMDRVPAVSGRVVDQHGYPVDGAEVMFFAESDPAHGYETVGYTDSMGYYITHEPLDGRYTAMVHFFAEQNGLSRADHFNATWLGNTADRSQAQYIEFDGDNRGGVDFVVNRGETYRHWTSDIDPNDPVFVTTDHERDGATDKERLEVSGVIASTSYISVGTFYDPTAPTPGFTSTGFSATVVHSPAPGSIPMELDFVLDGEFLAGPSDDMQVVWNGRLLRACSSVAPPCEKSRATDSRGDYVISVTATDGGEASFVWGPSFLDTGLSIFMNDIEWLADEGVTKGCSPPINDLFCPDSQVTRGQMAAFLVRFLGLTDRGTVDFSDDNGSVFEADIERLATAGITKGCNPPTNDQFCPHDPVTREQMAAFLSRALKLPAATGIDFGDDDGSIFEDSIERLAAAGITRGCNPPVNDQFCPTTIVTREQMAAFLHRADTRRP